MPRFLLATTVTLGLFAPAYADPPLTSDTPTATEIGQVMRTLILTTLPTPLVEDSHNWGKQKEVTNGVTLHGLKPEKQKKVKNDGTWSKVRIEALEPEKNLELIVFNVQKPGKGTLTFDVLTALPTRVTFEQQVWKSGVRLYSGETRAKVRPVLLVRCESTTKTVKGDSLIPDLVFRMRVLDAKLTYDGFKVEHVAGVGGDMAKVLGNAAHDMVKQVRPSLERNMLEKAEKAIIKAGDTKEVKVSLGKLLDGK